MENVKIIKRTKCETFSRTQKIETKPETKRNKNVKKSKK